MTVQINFSIHAGGEYEDINGTKSSCLIAQEILTLSSLQGLFPFEGEFHFRQKKMISRDNVGPYGAEGYVWVDIQDDDMISPTNNIVDIQALCISLPPVASSDDGPDEEHEYLRAVEKSLADANLDVMSRPDRRPVKILPHGSEVDPITLVASAAVDMAKQFQTNKAVKSMAKTAGNIWTSMKQAATNVGLQLTTPTDNLEKLNGYLCTQYECSSNKHNMLLEELWDSLFPGYLFEPDSARWKSAGFQHSNPALDLKGTGLLSLKSMLYMGKNYPEKTQQMLLKNTSNVKTNYPFAVVGINMTILLSDILGIREKRYMGEDDYTLTYYELFEDRKSYYEIYCFCFFYIDHLWNVRKAIRKDFASLIETVRSLISKTMENCPHTIKEFKSVASEVDSDVNAIFSTSY